MGWRSASKWTADAAGQLVYEDHWQKIYRVEAAVSGTRREFFVRDVGSRAGVLLVDEGSVLLVRQPRLLVDELSWEIPGGRVEEGETVEQAAARECLEECGIRCQRLSPLVRFHPGLDSLYNPTVVFFAEEWEASMAADTPHAAEIHTQAWTSLDRALEMIARGEIVDALSIVALLTYARAHCS